MNFEQQLKEEAIRLIRSGHRDQAKVLFQSRLQITSEEADKLIEALVSETRKISPTGLPDRVINVTGCISAFLLIFSFLFGLIALAFTIVAGVFYFMSNPFQNGAEATGKVISLEWNDTGGAVPVLQYEWEGQLKEAKGTVYYTPPQYEVGEQIPILINPVNPDEIILNNYSERYEFTVLFGAVGAVFLIFTIIFVYVRRKIKVSFDNSN